jgi:fumarate hydratase class II
MIAMRKETDSLGVVEVPADKLWGAQTQRSLQHFSIGQDLIPREMITAYATLKKAAAIANRAGKRLDDERYKLIVQTCDEILAGKHHDMFPLHVWMTGSGTQFNMNVNEVISNRCSQLAGTALGSHAPVHPNDHINMAQSSNDSFPSAMCIAAAVNVKQRLIPAVAALRDAIDIKAKAWDDVVKIGRTHMQDATPLTLGQEWSGYVGMLSDNLERIDAALRGVYLLALGGTAVGTGINSAPDFAEAVAAEIAKLSGLPFVTAPNKFTVQGAHDARHQDTWAADIAGALRRRRSRPAGFRQFPIPSTPHIFPAVGMAIFATQASRVTDEMFIEAAASIADQVAPELLERGLLYPLQANILETEIQTAARVAKLVFDSNLARVPRPADMVACALRGMKQRRCSAPSPTTRSRS